MEKDGILSKHVNRDAAFHQAVDYDQLYDYLMLAFEKVLEGIIDMRVVY